MEAYAILLSTDSPLREAINRAVLHTIYMPAGKLRDSGTLRWMSKPEVFQSMPASVPRVEQSVAAKVKRAHLEHLRAMDARMP